MKVDSLTSLPALGALWPEQGGHFAGITRDASGATFAVIVPPKGVGELPAAEWGGYSKDTPSAQHVTDGQANTLALLADKHEHPAAAACAAFEHEGHADWYLPSIGELRLAHMHCPELFETSDWYWSSTQDGRNFAWAQVFEDGFSYGTSKDSSVRVRAFRRFVKWQVLPAEAETLRYAVDLYETILLASSPQQMATAVDLRMQALKGQTMETLEETQK